MNINLHLCVLIYILAIEVKIFAAMTSNKTGQKREFKIESAVLSGILFYTQLTVKLLHFNKYKNSVAIW